MDGYYHVLSWAQTTKYSSRSNKWICLTPFVIEARVILFFQGNTTHTTSSSSPVHSSLSVKAKINKSVLSTSNRFVSSTANPLKSYCNTLQLRWVRLSGSTRKNERRVFCDICKQIDLEVNMQWLTLNSTLLEPTHHNQTPIPLLFLCLTPVCNTFFIFTHFYYILFHFFPFANS